MLTKWLDSLAAPGTGQALTLAIDHVDGDHVLRGTLRGGDVDYPIINGVPRFTPSQFSEDTPRSSSDIVDTVNCYSAFWNDPTAQAQPTPAELAAHQQVLLAMLGTPTLQALTRLFADDTNILDAGCGIAWSEYLFNVNPRARRFAVDLSTSVEVAFQRTRSLPNVFVAQADLFRLPFRLDFFDVIFSAGVLHHTADPADAFRHLCRHLKPGGLIATVVYRVKPFLRELADREIKRHTTAMTPAECDAFCQQIASLGRSLQRIREPLSIDDDIPLLGISKGEFDLQKFIFDHFLKCYYSAALGWQHSVRANIDWYRPKHASHHSRQEVSGWFEGNDISEVHFTELPGWEHSSFFVSGRKTS